MRKIQASVTIMVSRQANDHDRQGVTDPADVDARMARQPLQERTSSRGAAAARDLERGGTGGGTWHAATMARPSRCAATSITSTISTMLGRIPPSLAPFVKGPPKEPPAVMPRNGWARGRNGCPGQMPRPRGVYSSRGYVRASCLANQDENPRLASKARRISTH